MAEAVQAKLVRVSMEASARRDNVHRWKLYLAAAAFLAAAGWWAAGWAIGPAGRMRYSIGPVSRPHAAWDAQCSTCHPAYAPMNHHSVAAGFFAGPHAADMRCESCHAGPPHHASQVDQPSRACADCHHEHRGREASLVRLPDGDCTSCHSDLRAWRKPGAAAQFADSVPRFDIQAHPAFRSNAKDPGRLRFNHQLHLAPGMTLTPSAKANPNARIPFTLDRIAIADRGRYRTARQALERDNTELVRLDCTACHHLDGADAPVASGLMRSKGDYMLPISYERDCKTCHPLTLEEPTARRPRPLAVPHRQQPQALHEYLEGHFLRQYLSDEPNQLLERFVPPLVVPRKPGPAARMEGKEEEKARAYVADKVQSAEQMLYVGKQTCGECHIYDTPREEVTIADIVRGREPAFHVVPTALPEIWFPHAIFGHAAHRALACRECHANADSSTVHTDVLIPGIANCVQCHAPRDVRAATGGARFDCTECHRYHHGDMPLHGRGSAARGTETKHSTALWLSGNAKPAAANGPKQ